MAPTLDPITIIPWPLFTAYDVDGTPIIGAMLYSYHANTSTPKATYADPYLTVPNENPCRMDDRGQRLVYLKGFYRLVLTDREGRQIWEIDNYEFPSSTEPPEGGVIHGYTEGVVNAVNGESVLTAPNLCPIGYRVEGAICRIDTTFGASSGLQEIHIGDAILGDRWGKIGLDAGMTTIQRDFRSADRPIANTAYTVLISAISGRFDSAGVLTIRVHWSSIGGWS